MAKTLSIPNIGDKFGKLTILSYSTKIINKRNTCMVLCVCECGKIIEKRYQNVKTGFTQSCGCLATQNGLKLSKMNIKHGMAHRNNKSRLYNIWQGMKRRCYNKNDINYKRYGAKNIIVCDEWKNSFTQFYNWAITYGYQDDLSIDRINNLGNYEPSNCRFANRETQENNRSDNIFLTAFGETKTVAQWIRDPKCKIKNDDTLIYRIRKMSDKLTPEEMLTILPKCTTKLNE